MTGPTGPAGAFGPTPSCPFGYVQAPGAKLIACTKPLAKGTSDEVVRVGSGASAFWIDRYEAVLADSSGAPVADASASPPGQGFPPDGQWVGASPPYHAESRSGVMPTHGITWFQAVEACAASGKRLPSGSEWLRAARGTLKSLGDQNSVLCNIAGAGPRAAGGGTSCVSGWGAEDMIGNLAEWTDDWYAGVGAANTGAVTPWPQGYGSDGTYNIASSSYYSALDAAQGLPSAAHRGGSCFQGEQAGIFTLDLNSSPARSDAVIGFRCLLSH